MRLGDFFAKTAEVVIKIRWLVLLIVVGLSVGSVYLIATRIEVDNAFESYFIKDDPQKKIYDKFKQDFGEDTYVYVLYEVNDAFTPETLAENYRLTKRLEKEVPYGKRFLSITTAELVFGEDDELVIRRIGDNLPKTQNEAERWREIIKHKRFYVDTLVSSDFKSLAILIPCDFSGLKTTKQVNDAKARMTQAVYKVLESAEFKHLNARAVGDPIFNSQYAHWTASETVKLSIISTIAIVLLLFFVFRRLSGVVVPFLIVNIAILWTFGLLALFAKMRLTSSILPPLLSAVGICDSIHILSEFDVQFLRLRNRKRALIETLRMLGYPCLLTSVTTAAGFVSLVVAPIRPLRETGLLAAFGVMAAFVLTITLIVALLSFGSDEPRGVHKPEDFLSFRLMERVYWFTKEHPVTVGVIHLGLLVVGLIGLAFVNVDTYWLKNFGKDVKMRQDYEFVDAHMGSSGALEVVVDSGKEDGAKDPKLLRALEAASYELERLDGIKKVIGLPLLLAEINRALHNEDDRFYRVPETRMAIAQMLLLYENAGGGLLDDFLDFSRRKVRITAYARSMSDMNRKRLIEQMQRVLDRHLQGVPHGSVEITGILRIAVVLTGYVVPSQIKSFIAAFVVVTLLLMIFFRSIKTGIIGMAPTTLPVIVTTGVMGFTGINLDWVVTMVAAIGIGLSVDNTIHFFSRFRHEFELVRDYDEAARLALTEVGRALVFNAFVLVLGFGVAASSIMINVARFGQLSALLISLSLFICVLLSPVLLKRLKPFGEPSKPNRF